MWGDARKPPVGDFGHRLAVLCYHRVSRDGRLGSFHTSGIGAELLHEQITYLRKSCEVLPLEEALERLEFGTIPKRAVAVTFDDGYAELAESAFPILWDLRVPATVFLVAGHVGTDAPFWWEEVASRVKIVTEQVLAKALQPCDLQVVDRHHGWVAALIDGLKRVPNETRETFMNDLRQATGCMNFPRMSLNWEEVRAARSWGISFGSHSLTHPNLTSLGQEALARELRISREIIESMAGSSCRVLAYPHGDHNERVRGAVESAGYRWAATMERGTNGRGENRLTLRRYPVYAYHDEYLFPAMLRGWLNLPYGLAAKARKIKRLRRKSSVVSIGTGEKM